MPHDRKLELAVLRRVWAPMRHALFQSLTRSSEVRMTVYSEKKSLK